MARMAAGLQLKNTLTSKDPTVKTQYQQRWLSFPEETRAYVKKNVMLFHIAISSQCFYYNLLVLAVVLYLGHLVNSSLILTVERLCYGYVLMRSSNKAYCI